MKQITLIRHAETVLVNMSQEEIKKTRDPELSENGRAQAKEVRSFLKSIDSEIIFSSLYKRARETAEIVNDKNKQVIATSSLNEYYLDADGKGVESTSEGAARAMSKLYSVFDLYEEIVIVAHSSINQTILQNLLNLKFKEAGNYFNKFGETHVLRYDWKKGDSNWKIFQSFTPKQS